MMKASVEVRAAAATATEVRAAAATGRTATVEAGGTGATTATGGGSGGGGDIGRLIGASAGDDDPAVTKTPNNDDVEAVEELQESQQATGAQQVRTVV